MQKEDSTNGAPAPTTDAVLLRRQRSEQSVHAMTPSRTVTFREHCRNLRSVRNVTRAFLYPRTSPLVGEIG